MRVLIVGGGIAGLTLAFWLHRGGHQVVLVEIAPELRGGGYMIDFIDPGYSVADQMGLLPELQRIHYPIQYLSFVDSHGKTKFSLAYPKLREAFNDRHFNFLRGDLERVLYSAVKDDVEVRFGTTITALDQDATALHVTLSDRTTEVFDLLVGADGLHSRVRELAFGDESRFLRFLGYYTSAYLLHGDDTLDVRRDAFQTLSEPKRQAAVYPFHGGIATFFVYEAQYRLRDRSRATAMAELHRVYGDMNWLVPELLERSADADDLYFDELAQIEMPCWSTGRVTLVGDACQCLSLLAGQGASMAVAGARILAEEIQACPSNMAMALARYEKRLKPAVEKRQAAGRSFARWFVPDNRPRQMLANLFMRFATTPLLLPVFRRQFELGGQL